MLQYVIQRRLQHDFWCGPAPDGHADQWISDPAKACTFEFVTGWFGAAETALRHCPISCDGWTIEPVEIPAPGDDAA